LNSYDEFVIPVLVTNEDIIFTELVLRQIEKRFCCEFLISLDFY